MEGALSPTQELRIREMITEAFGNSQLDVRVTGLRTEIDDVKKVSSELLLQTDGVLKSIQAEATKLREDMASQIEEMRAQHLATQAGLTELNGLGARLREIATANDETVTRARRDIDSLRQESLAAIAEEMESIKTQAMDNQAGLNRLYQET